MSEEIKDNKIFKECDHGFWIYFNPKTGQFFAAIGKIRPEGGLDTKAPIEFPFRDLVGLTKSALNAMKEVHVDSEGVVRDVGSHKAADREKSAEENRAHFKVIKGGKSE